MAYSSSRPLRVFLCHAAQDKLAVRVLYNRLKNEPWIDPWLDEEKLLPGQDFDLEIYKAIRDADIIIVCLSNESVRKEGYVQKEFKRALNLSEEKPEGSIYIIPLRLDECEPPIRFQQYHWLDYFKENSHEKLLKSLRARSDQLKLSELNDIDVTKSPFDSLLAFPDKLSQTFPSLVPTRKITPSFYGVDLDLYRFVEIPQTSHSSYSFWIGKYPVTNSQYERFLKAIDYASETYWREFPKFDEYSNQIGRWRTEGWEWLEEMIIDPSDGPVMPRFWDDTSLGVIKPINPVVGITWYEANAYCKWLSNNWNELAENRANPRLRPRLFRLPLESEWQSAGGGGLPLRRYPWDELESVTKDEKEIISRANVLESNIKHTTPVNTYVNGASPHGVMDMAGNVWEWQANNKSIQENLLRICGGSWTYAKHNAWVYPNSDYGDSSPIMRRADLGFRVVAVTSGQP